MMDRLTESIFPKKQNKKEIKKCSLRFDQKKKRIVVIATKQNKITINEEEGRECFDESVTDDV